MHRNLRKLYVIGILIIGGSYLTSSCFGQLRSWGKGGGEMRQVVAVTAAVPRKNPVVELMLAGPANMPLRVATEEEPNRPLPVFRQANGAFCVTLPGQMQPGKVRYLIATWSGADGWEASSRLSECLVDGDDYATESGKPWDFSEGHRKGLSSSKDYRKVSVQDGVLVMEIKGGDSYIIWGNMFGKPNPSRDLHIDSGLYVTLSMRIRQSCEDATWRFYLTDAKGIYRNCDFHVHGKEFQTFSFDLKEHFKDFWDGRQFRALRIDTIKKRAHVTAEIDWVRLTRQPVAVEVGPLLSADDIVRRASVKKLYANFPYKSVAGKRIPLRIVALDSQNKPVKNVPVVVNLDVENQLVTSCVFKSETITVGVGTKAATGTWTLGLCDDLGHPANPVRSKSIKIAPAALDHYELIPARHIVPVTDAKVKLDVWGADRFGNRLPINLKTLKWNISGGGKVKIDSLYGSPASVTLTCASQPRVTHDIVLRDPQGREGRTHVRTLAHKSRPIRINPNGYLVDQSGELYMPLGGFYVNWPAGLPKPDGSISRSIDLFPCSAKPYLHGYPWSADTEQKVVDYLQLCKKNGVTGLRLMLRNMDIVGRVDHVQLKAVLHLLDLAKPLGIKFNIVLFEDYIKPPYVNLEIVEKIALPHYTEQELKSLPPHRARFLVKKEVLPVAGMRYTDRDAIRCQKEYLEELLPYLADREEVFCYEFENEMMHPPMSWVNDMAAFIREIDPKTPILGNPGPHYWPEPWRWRGSKIDLYSYHPYTGGQSDADHGAVVFMRSKWSEAAGFPMFTGEGGMYLGKKPDVRKSLGKAHSDYASRCIRDQIWFSIGCGANGAFMWTTSFEKEMAEFGKVLPALKAVGIDLRQMKRRRPRTVLIMPDDKFANNKACAIGYQLLSRGVDFDTRPVDAVEGYTQQIDAATADPATLAVEPELLKPTKGYQITYLASENLGQVLVYLRNTAGGIHAYGKTHPYHLRDPQTAQAGLELIGTKRWTKVKAFDLDTNMPVPVQIEGDKLIINSDTTHDYVLGLRR